MQVFNFNNNALQKVLANHVCKLLRETYVSWVPDGYVLQDVKSRMTEGSYSTKSRSVIMQGILSKKNLLFRSRMGSYSTNTAEENEGRSRSVLLLLNMVYGRQHSRIFPDCWIQRKSVVKKNYNSRKGSEVQFVQIRIYNYISFGTEGLCMFFFFK
jgi:hypothetical protein